MCNECITNYSVQDRVQYAATMPTLPSVTFTDLQPNSTSNFTVNFKAPESNYKSVTGPTNDYTHLQHRCPIKAELKVKVLPMLISKKLMTSMRCGLLKNQGHSYKGCYWAPNSGGATARVNRLKLTLTLMIQQNAPELLCHMIENSCNCMAAQSSLYPLCNDFYDHSQEKSGNYRQGNSGACRNE